MNTVKPPSVLFIFSPFAGHLNKTTMLARFYAEKGAKITFLVFGPAEWFQSKVPFATLIQTDSFPVGYASVLKSARKNPQQCLTARREILEKVIRLSNPTIVFFDEFCTSDFAIQYDIFKKIKCIFLIGRLPNIPDSRIPPLHSGKQPHIGAFIDWYLSRAYQFIRQYYLLISDPASGLIWSIKRMKKEGKNIPKFTFYANQNPVYPDFEWWYQFPEELDFYTRNLTNGSRYMGPMLDVDRQQKMLPRVAMFLKKIELTPGSKLIYCTFGTVISSFITNDRLEKFYQKLNLIAKKHHDWHFLVSVPNRSYENLRPSGMNILFAQEVPQLEVLKKSTLCMSHGGGGTTIESMYFGVPLLCISPGSSADYKGNATRIYFHRVGKRADFSVSNSNLEGLISELITESIYRTNAQKMSATFQQKYSGDYLDRMNLPNA